MAHARTGACTSLRQLHWRNVSLEQVNDTTMSGLSGGITFPIGCQRNEDQRIRVRPTPKFDRFLLGRVSCMPHFAVVPVA